MSHSFIAPSGITYEVTDFEGKHQRLLSQQTGGIGAINKTLADCILKIGLIGVNNLTEDAKIETVKRMPAEDRVFALFQIRQYTFDFDVNFKFKYKYESVNPNTYGQLLTVEVETPLSATFRPYLEQVTELDQIVFERRVLLPRCGQTAVFNIADGASEDIAAAQKNISSHTPLLMRNPRIVKETDKNGKPIAPQMIIANLDNMKAKDVETLRAEIERVEGKTEIKIVFRHPEAEYLPPSERLIELNPMAQPVFFFPSMVI